MPDEKFQVLAFKCENRLGDYGILASVEDETGTTILTTDESWKCSRNFEEGWSDMNFNDDHWPNVVAIYKNGRTIGGISPEAQWIWHPDRQSAWTVYCRQSILG